MNIREEVRKRIEKKQEEIRDLETRTKEAYAYIQALQDTLKLLPRDSATAEARQQLRPGTDMAKTRDMIKAAGKALHITDILKGLNRPNDHKNRTSIAGSLSGYVRNGQVFTRPAPNTFGLIERDESDAKPSDNGELPDSFGTMQ